MLTQCHAKCRVPVQHLQVDLLLVLPFSMPGCVILAELERVYVQLCMSALLLYPKLIMCKYRYYASWYVC